MKNIKYIQQKYIATQRYNKNNKQIITDGQLKNAVKYSHFSKNAIIFTGLHRKQNSAI